MRKLLWLGVGLTVVALVGLVVRKTGAAPAVLQWKGLAWRWGAFYKVPPDIILGVIHKESSGNPRALSSAGAMGLMQLMPATARGIGFTGPLSKLFEPETNVKYGTLYLSELLSSYPLKMSLQRYYAGGKYWLGEDYAEDVLRFSKMYA